MRYLVVPLAVVALSLTACQGSADSPPVDEPVSASETVTSTPSASPSPSVTPSPTSTPTPSLLAAPDFRTKSSCSVATGKYPKMHKGVRFTAEATVVNKGNIGATIQVKAIWNGKTPVRRARAIPVGYGKSVKVTLNAPTTPSEVTVFRGNGASRCAVTVKVLSFLGKPHAKK